MKTCVPCAEDGAGIATGVGRTAKGGDGGAGATGWGGVVAAGVAGFGGDGKAFGGTAGAATRGAEAGGVTTGWGARLGLAGTTGEAAGNTAPQKPQNLLPAGISLRQLEHTVGVAAGRRAGGVIAAG